MTRIKTLLPALLLLCAAACGGSKARPESTTPAAGAAAPTPSSPGDVAACKHAACGECVGEAGCWWHLDTLTCTLGEEGCTGSNCTNGTDSPCPQ